jgi:hypothetical protein
MSTWAEVVQSAVDEVAGERGVDPATITDRLSFWEALDEADAQVLDGDELADAVREAAEAPYGDVTYADPGYQADGKKRYPLDSAEHVRAALSYIGQERNAGQYSAADLAKVKDAIDRAAKRYGIEASATEAVVSEAGRVIEAKGNTSDGGRVFGVRIIKFGDSRNGRRYTPGVMREAVKLYEGAKAYDHHRTDEELRTSTLTGLIGSYRNVEAREDGLYGDLHLLPGATHAAEALNASIAAQAEGRPPLVGISHDVRAHFRTVTAGGRRLQEATQIVDVQSADVVANPSAGGLAVRAVAGGTEEEHEEEETDVAVTTESVLDALKDATPEQLGAVGLQRASEATPAGPPTRAVEADRATEAETFAKGSVLGAFAVKEKLAAVGLTAAAEAITGALPDRFTEADIDAQIKATKDLLAAVERPGLTPTRFGEGVTSDERDKKIKRLDATFAQDFQNGYHSFKEAYLDWTGAAPRMFDADINRQILRESFGDGYESRSGTRATESMTSATWNTVLGDSVTRRLVAFYNTPDLMDWKQLVSSMPPVNDFRTQRIERIGGYGILPTVAQGAPYQPLTSPGNEEVTYAISKRGGTEDVTMEMIANDDLRSISRIPTLLALAAKRTIFDFVFEMIRPSTGTGPLGTAGNPTIYDSVALYASGHANTTTTALSQSAVSASRNKMRQQAGYGDTQNILSAIPKFLLVPPTLEELAFQICTSAVAVPATPAGPSDTPNLHKNLDYIVIDYWDAISATQWALIADPNLIPTIEVGFYQGQQDPQLFTQSDPSVGSMFNSDRFTWKIRHIYSGAVLDYRGMQRGNS